MYLVCQWNRHDKGIWLLRECTDRVVHSTLVADWQRVLNWCNVKGTIKMVQCVSERGLSVVSIGISIGTSRLIYIYAWCKLRLLRRELTYCIRVWKISAIVIVVVCVSYMYVQRSSDSCKYGHNRSAHSIWWVCLTAWLKILQTGKNRARPIIMSRHIFAAVYRSHRSC